MSTEGPDQNAWWAECSEAKDDVAGYSVAKADAEREARAMDRAGVAPGMVPANRAERRAVERELRRKR